jgi:hypothetical protein
MNIFTNEALIKRNTRVAQIASLTGLVVLIGGMIVSFTRQELVNIAFAALLVGFVLSQVGIYYTNRWGRRPRPDELLNTALKGLDGKYAIYHYLTPASHVLVGPAGVWVLMARHQRGMITYEKGRWRQRGGGPLQAYLRMFAQEGLGRPDLEILNEIEALQKHLNKKLPEGSAPAVQSALIFTNPNVDLRINEEEVPTAPTMILGDLKEFIRKSAKNKGLSQTKATEIQQALSAS